MSIPYAIVATREPFHLYVGIYGCNC